MKGRYVLSPEAEADLIGIWEYTRDHWNADQADTYILALIDVVQAVASGKRKGRSCDQIRSGYFRVASGSHVIFYRMSDATMDVVRILHQRMDFNRHL